MEIGFENYIEAILPLKCQPKTARLSENNFYFQVKSVDKTELIVALHEEPLLSDGMIAASAMSVAHSPWGKCFSVD